MIIRKRPVVRKPGCMTEQLAERERLPVKTGIEINDSCFAQFQGAKGDDGLREAPIREALGISTASPFGFAGGNPIGMKLCSLHTRSISLRIRRLQFVRFGLVLNANVLGRCDEGRGTLNR